MNYHNGDQVWEHLEGLEREAGASPTRANGPSSNHDSAFDGAEMPRPTASRTLDFCPLARPVGPTCNLTLRSVQGRQYQAQRQLGDDESRLLQTTPHAGQTPFGPRPCMRNGPRVRGHPPERHSRSPNASTIVAARRRAQHGRRPSNANESRKY